MLVKSRCDKCGHSEKYTKKELRINNIKKHLMSLFVMLGIIFFLYIIIAGPTNTVESLTSTLMIKFASVNSDHDELRHLGINWTSDCEPNTICYAYNVFNNLNIRYVPASLISPLQSPMETLEFGGDCKNSAIFYTSMMKSLGQKAQVVCSLKHTHCVSVVYDTNGFYYLIDLTIPAFYINPNSEDVWSYMEEENIYINTQLI